MSKGISKEACENYNESKLKNFNALRSRDYKDKEDLDLCLEYQKTLDSRIYNEMFNRYKGYLTNQAKRVFIRVRECGLNDIEFDDLFQEFSIKVRYAMLAIKQERIENPETFRFSIHLGNRIQSVFSNLINKKMKDDEKLQRIYADSDEALTILIDEASVLEFSGQSGDPFFYLSDNSVKRYIYYEDVRLVCKHFTSQEHSYLRHRINRKRTFENIVKNYQPKAREIRDSLKGKLFQWSHEFEGNDY